MTQYAKLERKSAALHTDFAKEFVLNKLGDVVAAALYRAIPCYTRGPRKGLQKGYVHWIKCTEGGWYRDGANSRVLLPGTREVVVRWNADPLSTVLLDPGAWSSDERKIAVMLATIEQVASKRRYG